MFKKQYPKVPAELKNIKLKKELSDLMPLELIKEFRAFVFEKNEKGVKIGAVNPEDPNLKQFLKAKFGAKFSLFQATEENLKAILKDHKPDLKNEIMYLASGDIETSNNITKIVDGIIKYAIEQKASDIHLESIRNGALVRLRVDGALHTVFTFPRNIYQAIVAHLKILANLKIDEYRRPQDGRIEPENMPDISLRISTIPTLFGEKIALRVLDDLSKNLSIDKLGLSENQKNLILENIEKPFGMIVASGPTGCGKTTTLYTFLQALKKEGLNISTLEDPIEYILKGVNQTQINTQAQLTFPSGLRALLRQDPDIIMVGEIRDSDTAIMATNAALTGHLVFTTLHTNDAPSAFIRFLEMKVEDFVVSSTVNLIIAQRLVRKVCEHCATDEKISPIILKKIKERKDIISALEAKEQGLSKEIEKQTFKIGKGCDACFQTGYLGRIGIFELLTPNPEIHNIILNHGSAEKIKQAAEKEGFRDMITNGLNKVLEGETTFDELLRVTKTN